MHCKEAYLLHLPRVTTVRMVGGGGGPSLEESLETETETMRIYGTVARDTPEEVSFSTVIMTVYGLCGGVFLFLVIFLCGVALSPLSNKHRSSTVIQLLPQSRAEQS